MSSRAGTSKDDDATARETSLLFDDSSFFANISAAAEAASPGPRAGDRSADSNALNVSALCCDEEVSGFDRLSGRTWIYPTNYPVRDYQFNIIKAAILQNTLVSLPTGLGKTFIAAVVMYNFYRWYPLGRVVFAAPTRPLVAQQVGACYEVAAIPRADTVEMTGHMPVAARRAHWTSKRVIFATPQVIYNDLKSGICPAERLRCLVLDEAHRARGNYAYGQIVGALDAAGHRTYRVLALSATPGSKVEHVVSVVRSLHIAHLELRTESCIDVRPYSHRKNIHSVVVPLGAELAHLRQNYVEILDGYARRLQHLNILGGNAGNLSKGRIIMLYKEFRSRDRSARHAQHNEIMRDFTLLITLYHGLEVLARHGSRVFLNFFDSHAERSWLQRDARLTALLERLRCDLGADPLLLDRSALPDGTVAAVPADLNFGHPKFERLREIVTAHFRKAADEGRITKAIVFCEYRESVSLVHCLLLQLRPLVQPMMFVGQGTAGREGAAAVSQRAQLRVMRSFRDGACNALVATCVAEEGLDVGSVDLIVCFDVATRSPVRLVQRCGRTGRERGGTVHILVTEGREHQTLQECMRQRDNLNQRVLRSAEVQRALYTANPRMMPRDLTPACTKMYITAAAEPDVSAAKKPGQRDLRSMLGERSASGPRPAASPAVHVTREEFETEFPAGLPPAAHYLATPSELWCCSLDEFKSNVNQHRKAKLKLSEWLEWQRRAQNTVRVGHSSDTDTLARVLQYADEKRFQLQTSTQNPIVNTQMMGTQALQPPPPEPKRKMAPPKKKTKPNEPSRQGGDIRALFSTTKMSTKEYTKLVKEMGVEIVGNLPTYLIDLMVDLCVQDETTTAKCQTCEHFFECGLLKKLHAVDKIKIEPPTSILKDLKLPNINLLDSIDVESIEKYGCQTLDDSRMEQSSEDLFFDECASNDKLFAQEVTKEKAEISNEANLSTSKINATSNFELEFDFDFDESDVEESKDDFDRNVSKTNFDIGNIDDIFVDSDISSPDETNKKSTDKINDDKKEALGFFGLDSIDDIFADSSDEDVKIVENPLTKSNAPNSNQNGNAKVEEIENFTKDHLPIASEVGNRAPSPSLLAGTRVVNNTIVCSPILCSQKNRLSLKRINSAKCSTPLDNVTSRKILSMKPKDLFGQTTTQNTDVIDLDKDTGPTIQNETLEKSASKSHNDTIESKSLASKSNNDTIGSKSLFTITQLIDMINKPNDKSYVNSSPNNLSSTFKMPDDHESENIHGANISELNNRSSSPILFTQADLSRALRRSQSALNRSSKQGTTVESIHSRTPSPILFTQVKNTSQSASKCKNKRNQTCESLVVLDSDSDETMSYNASPVRVNTTTNSKEGHDKRNKRKFNHSLEDQDLCSPYFDKRPKLDNCTNKPLSLKDKLKSIFKTEDKDSLDIKNAKPDQTHIGYAVTTSSVLASQKENYVPDKVSQRENHVHDKFVCEAQNAANKSKNGFSVMEDDIDLLDDWFTSQREAPSSPILSQQSARKKLQKFRRDLRKVGDVSLSRDLENAGNDNTSLSDSDDDFVVKNNNNQKKHSKEDSPVINYKVRKKKRSKASEFLELEAELSSASWDSGDEMSDDSALAGSIVDFICDEEHPDGDRAVDMQAHYLRSVKSPANGMFKIPALPNRLLDVLSQPDPGDDDNYEMDSFCVEGGVGLTQAPELSALELAERRYRRRRRAERRGRRGTGDSPRRRGRDGDSPGRRVGVGDSPGRKEGVGDSPGRHGGGAVDSPLARPNKLAKRKISSSDSE